MKLLARMMCVVAAGLSLTSCQTVPEEPQSAYGAFLAARYAGANRDAQGAADYYAEALQRAPGNAILSDRAFITALLAGELDAAVGFADAAIAVGDPSRLAALYRASDLIAERRFARARTVLESAPDFGPYNALMADLLMHWALAGEGQIDAARDAARRLASPGYLDSFIALHRALLADTAGDRAAAEEAFQAAIFSSPFQRMVTELYGGFLERQGDREQARLLYETYLRNAPGDEVITAELARLSAGGRAPQQPDIAESAALILFGPSASLAAQADMDMTVLYLRMIQRLYPEYHPNRLLLGETLQRIRLPEVALQEYAAVPPGPHWMGAQVDLIWLTARLDRMDDAVAQAEALVEASNGDEARLILADLYRVQARCADAIPLYGEVIANRQAQDALIDWRYPYFRASCQFVLGDLPAAETDYLMALELGPDEPQVLNDLGYLWLEKGVRLDEAYDMVLRASQLEPDQGHIIDSLGWAYYTMGDFENAVIQLERAVSLSPGNATANFHLGDAYWQVGRQLESRFQWERALTLEPSESERAALEDRLANGLMTEAETEFAENASGSANP